MYESRYPDASPKARYDYFLICPIRGATEEQKAQMAVAINVLKAEGKTIYYPATDTDQSDPIGYRICNDNRQAIADSDAVLLFFDKTSQGSLFDLGMAFAMGKPLVIVNNIEPTDGKSFSNMVLRWAAQREATDA